MGVPTAIEIPEIGPVELIGFGLAVFVVEALQRDREHQHLPLALAEKPTEA